MVLKVSKGGVRSGNTLRALRCVRNQRYSRHGCIIGRSSLSPADLPTFVDSVTDSDLVTSALMSTDVIMSLNKRKRWLLPAAVSHMIKAGRFSEGETMVSLLERHKLKKRANCVSFVCNQGRVRHVTPRQKRYFSFNLKHASDDQSNRERRRQKTKLLKGISAPQTKLRRGKNGEIMKTAEIYTLTGSVNIEKLNENPVRSKPEYSLDVLYPCPKTCSLMYNPKYTNITIENSGDGDEPIKAGIRSSRARRQHRKRLTMRDLMVSTDNDILSDVDELWDDDCEEVDSDIVSLERKKSNEDGFESNLTEESGESDHRENRSKFSENILASLIAEAEKARLICDNRRPQHRKRSSHMSTKDRAGLSDTESRSHVIYTHDQNRHLNPAESKIRPVTVLHAARVILLMAETVPEQLKVRYGHLYAEADSKPRRFVINVTEDIQNLLTPSRHMEQNAKYTSYLVFIHDGAYDEGLDTFKVIFNSNICTENERLSRSIPFMRISIEEIMNMIVSILLDMQQEQLPSFGYTNICDVLCNPVINFVNDVLSVQVDAFHISDEINKVCDKVMKQEMTACASNVRDVVENLDSNMFCDICYENINPTQPGAVPGTQLSRCGHSFCDECWRSHFSSKMLNGATKIVCPGYDCDVTVGPVTLLSLVHVTEVTQLLQRACQEEVQASPDSRWCPNPTCGRAVRVTGWEEARNTSFDVSCVCGQEFCFSCLSKAHWPATCEQAETYTDKLDTLKPPEETPDEPPSVTDPSPPVAIKPKKVTVVEVEGRVCPKCLNFIQKTGGCNHMVCKCGNEFCWWCLKQFSNHMACKPNPMIVFEYTRRIRIKHRFIRNSISLNTQVTPSKETLKLPNSRQKSTMYQRALQQRLGAGDVSSCSVMKDIVKKISGVAHRNLTYKKEIVSYFGSETNSAEESALGYLSVAPHVTKFIRSCEELKKALHHVAEFTFVLLQDTPDSVDKRRALRLANDLSGYCCFIKSVLDLGENQDVQIAFKRLTEIQMWAKRALAVLISTVDKLKR